MYIHIYNIIKIALFFGSLVVQLHFIITKLKIFIHTVADASTSFDMCTPHPPS